MTIRPTHFKLYLAPLRGFTDYIYRNAFIRHFSGFDGALSPFIPTLSADRFKLSHLKDVLPENNTALPVVPQLIGNNPDDFNSIAGCLFDLGYINVNWNLGCPYPMVAKKQRGSGLLPYPEKIDAFLAKTLAAIPNRLSIKARLGRTHPAEILKLIHVFNQYPLEEIIIHPRTGKQMYDGEPDLDMFEKCLELSVHRIVYNGDINDLASFERFCNRFTSIDRWMIGRGAVANPFLPASIKTGQDAFPGKVETFRQFYEDLFAQYRQVFSGPGHLLARMKGFWTYFSQSFVDGPNIRRKIHRTHKLPLYEDIVERFFEEDAQWAK